MSDQFILLLSFVLFFLVCSQIDFVERFEHTTDHISTFFEPNLNSIAVEAFGDEDGMGGGYWGGAANQNSMVRSTGPPVGGTQLAAYQLYQQAVNASTPTVTQLQIASNLPGGGYGYIDRPDAPGLVPPAGKDTFYDAAAVDFGNRRAELISPCAQNAPTFVASTLLPKINIPGTPSWSVLDTKALANQDFLSATQQIGVDTVMSSNRNPSYDIRTNIPNPIQVVSPWNNSTITPDLQRRPLSVYQPADGVYGTGVNNMTYGPQGGPLHGI
jgi:hypothetical protein